VWVCEQYWGKKQGAVGRGEREKICTHRGWRLGILGVGTKIVSDLRETKEITEKTVG